MRKFINYHKHSHKTNVRVPDSITTNEDYIKRILELGHTVLSSCEHGWQGAQDEVVDLALKNNLKPLISAEAYWVKDRFEKDLTNCHIFLGAMNEQGRQTLNDVLSEANLTGFYRQPRIDLPLLLSLPTDGSLIVTSACVAGWKYEDSDEIMRKLAEHFGKYFYYEVQYHNTEKQGNLNERILKLRKETNSPIIMGCDSHYIFPEQAVERSDFLLSKNMSYPDEEGWYMDYPDGDTCYQRFAKQGILTHDEITEAIDNTLIFGEVEEYDSPVFNTEIKLPTLYPDWTQEQKNNEYKRLIWQGWDRYKQDIPKEQWSTYEDEINKEIKVIVDTNMADYFIIDYYVVKRGKEKGGWITQSGRGSAASFFTNSLLGFSDIDRISAPVHMYPERFASTTRLLQSGSIPDIDLNEYPTKPFVEAQSEILGENHSYPLISYGTMKALAAWKMYSRSQGIPFEITNEVSQQIKKYELALKHAEDDEKDLITIDKYISPEYKEVFDRSLKYLGITDSWSIAPCSSLIYAGDIRKEIGLVKVKDNICCAADGHWIENKHMLKNDHLMVSVVGLINMCYRRATGKEPPSVKEIIKRCENDEAVWDIYSKGCTLGINQVEKESTTGRCMKYKPKNVSELAAFIAAIRPGGASYYKDFESRKPFSYGIESLDKEIQTKEFRYSFILYQEQIMRVLSYAGIDMGEAYTAIKNIAKKRVKEVLAYRGRFHEGITKKLVEDENKTQEEAEEFAERLWNVIEDASNYSFNASHAYCMAIDSIYCAWLKAHYPLAFYEVYIRLMEETKKKEKMQLAKEEAEQYFKIVFQPLRFGQDNRNIHADEATNTFINSLGGVKGFGTKVGEILYKCSKEEFTSFVDVMSWLSSNGIKRAKYEKLILIDYFQKFGNQNELMKIADYFDLFKEGQIKQLKKSAISDSPWLVDIVSRHSLSKRKDGSEGTSYKFETEKEVFDCLKEIENDVIKQGLEDVELRKKIKCGMDILGYADIVTGKEEDRRKLLITSVIPLKNKDDGKIWAYRVGTKSFGSGKSSRLTVMDHIYAYKPINKGDVISVEDFYRKTTRKCETYFYLKKYQII